MPIYEYTCNDCGQQSEVLVRSTSEPDCPNCGSKKMMKQLSIVAAPSKGPSGGERPSSGGSCGAGCGCHPH